VKAFIRLYERLDGTISTHDKVSAMVDYFRETSDEDAAWAVFFLSGRRLKRFISSRMLTLWFLEAVGLAEWLFDECYIAVGDTAEAIALLNDTFNIRHAEDELMTGDISLSDWMTQYILPLDTSDREVRRIVVTRWWRALDTAHVFIMNKLLTGSFRVGVSQKLLIRALSEVSGLEPSVLSHRLMGHWEPTPLFYRELIAAEYAGCDLSKPYPFFLAYPLEQPPDALGPVSDWQIEWKWDGIRSQCICREGKVFLWSRGEELLTGRFPELEAAAALLPSGMVLDGEILAHDGNQPLPFSVLQTRIGRKNVGRKLLADAPVAFMAYDILEYHGRDVRQEPLLVRRHLLEEVLNQVGFPLIASPVVSVSSWADALALREESRFRGVEGYVLKRLNAVYQSGRRRGDWWKWKVDPYTVDAVLLYAQAGTGRRADLYTDYTFAVWHGDSLVPIAKAYSGLSNAEIEMLDQWIRENTLERFGPVRSVKPHHVFELAFEGISESKRHKSGVAIRFPRILRWRADKPMEEADTLDYLKAMLQPAFAENIR
jgi:DNA ligase 1